MRYYDTSAIVKRYVEERGSEAVRGMMEEDAMPVTGAASGAETAAALAAAVRVGRPSRQMHRAARQLGLATYPEDLDAFYARRDG